VCAEWQKRRVNKWARSRQARFDSSAFDATAFDSTDFDSTAFDSPPGNADELSLFSLLSLYSAPNLWARGATRTCVCGGRDRVGAAPAREDLVDSVRDGLACLGEGSTVREQNVVRRLVVTNVRNDGEMDRVVREKSRHRRVTDAAFATCALGDRDFEIGRHRWKGGAYVLGEEVHEWASMLLDGMRSTTGATARFETSTTLVPCHHDEVADVLVDARARETAHAGRDCMSPRAGWK